jgi:hypothetical protein
MSLILMSHLHCQILKQFLSLFCQGQLPKIFMTYRLLFALIEVRVRQFVYILLGGLTTKS